MLDRPADQRMAFEDADAVGDDGRRRGRCARLFPFQEEQQPLEVVYRPAGVDYFRHVTGAGRALRLPRTRSST